MEILSGTAAIDSFVFEEVEFVFCTAFMRLGDMGNAGTAIGTPVEGFSGATSFCIGVGDRGGVCSDGRKRLDEA